MRKRLRPQGLPTLTGLTFLGTASSNLSTCLGRNTGERQDWRWLLKVTVVSVLGVSDYSGQYRLLRTPCPLLLVPWSALLVEAEESGTENADFTSFFVPPPPGRDQATVQNLNELLPISSNFVVEKLTLLGICW